MSYEPTEAQLEEWGEKILDSIVGFTKTDFEPLFEKYILTIYVVAAWYPTVGAKWKVINNETGEEYKREYGLERMRKLGLV